MKRCFFTAICVLAVSMSLPALTSGAVPGENNLDRVLSEENQSVGIDLQPTPVVDDLTFLRRVSVDLIGRIPTRGEIQEFLAWPAESRREQAVDKLLEHERFADRWAAFFGDMLRLRSNAEGGAALQAYIHRALKDEMPYDELARRLLSTNGKAGYVPEVGFILGDNADPMALAGVTSQIFLGVRIACAQCHDHPFDVWTQEDFYGLAAYFGKTQRRESRIGNRLLSVYTTELPQTTILWPPEGAADSSERKPMTPTFPFELSDEDRPSRPVARLLALREEQETSTEDQQATGPSVDDLLDDVAGKVEQTTRQQGAALSEVDDISEAKREARRLAAEGGPNMQSELRIELAERITDPRNRFFARSFVNRIWAELIGRGIVDPVDDFTESNPPSHPETLDYLADEFIAHGYDLKSLLRMIVTSDVYQREHVYDVDEATRIDMETAFLATPVRRMISEVLYDSIVAAGHLFEKKHEDGKNLKTVWQQTRVMKQSSGDQSGGEINPVALGGGSDQMTAMRRDQPGAGQPGYNLEKAIELDFQALLDSGDEENVELDEMQVMSAEELEAERMQQERQRQQAQYFDRFVKTTFDDNPQFNSSFRMASPAPPGHFLRVFGQTDRQQLGEKRDHNPSMRQALLLLNGRLTHEAARVGELEPIYELLAGPQPKIAEAVRQAYLEILTREPTDDEVADAESLILEADSPLDGMADFRWVLLNSNEFRFLP